MNTTKYKKQNYHFNFFLPVLVFLIAGVIFGISNYKFASAATVPESCYTFDSGTGTITGYDYMDPLCLGDVDIPATIGGVAVTVIGDSAFRSEGLTSVTIPNGVLTIEEFSFGYNNLQVVNIPNSVQTIGDYAFYDNDIVTLNLGNSVNLIGSAAFYSNQITSLTIPDSVVTISDSAFQDNQLSLLDLGDSLETIGTTAFADNNLVTVNIPDSVTSIDCAAFHNNNITTAVIGNGLTSICGGGVFQGSPLVNLQIGTTDYFGPATLSLQAGEFSGYPIENLVLGNNVSLIGGGAFSSTNITKLTIPVSVTEVSASAFQGSKLKEVIMMGNTLILPAPFNNISSVTGEYVRLFTFDPSNPQGYVDFEDIYIVNPAAVTIKYFDSHGNPIAPELYETGDGLTDYTVAANPTADFSLYYRSGQSLESGPQVIDGYQTPVVQSVNLLPGSNTITYVYYTPAEWAALNQPGAPNTGIARSTSSAFYFAVILTGSILLVIFAIKRSKVISSYTI